jgi:hypothetical protein
VGVTAALSFSPNNHARAHALEIPEHPTATITMKRAHSGTIASSTADSTPHNFCEKNAQHRDATPELRDTHQSLADASSIPICLIGSLLLNYDDFINFKRACRRVYGTIGKYWDYPRATFRRNPDIKRMQALVLERVESKLKGLGGVSDVEKRLEGAKRPKADRANPETEYYVKGEGMCTVLIRVKLDSSMVDMCVYRAIPNEYGFFCALEVVGSAMQKDPFAIISKYPSVLRDPDECVRNFKKEMALGEKGLLWRHARCY